MFANILPLLLCLGPGCPPSADDKPAPAAQAQTHPTDAASPTTPAPAHADAADLAVIRATGIGKPPPNKPAPQAKLMARRAAEVVALRNLAAKLHGQQVCGDGERIEARTQALISGFRYLEPRTLDDGSVEITVELPLPTLVSNHDAIVERTALLEAELRDVQAQLKQLTERENAAKAELERARARIAQLQAWIDANAAALEKSAAEGRALLRAGAGP